MSPPSKEFGSAEVVLFCGPGETAGPPSMMDCRSKARFLMNSPVSEMWNGSKCEKSSWPVIASTWNCDARPKNWNWSGPMAAAPV